jgi:hypothetical protein
MTSVNEKVGDIERAKSLNYMIVLLAENANEDSY